jgi:NADH dehydrogenase FAD-containing subunit
MAGETGERFDCDVLILGASFAGVELVRRLRRDPVGRGLTVTVVDRQPAHGYIPLVQERMVGRLPLDRSELATAKFVEARPGARYVVGEVRGLDPARKEVTLASGERLRGRFIVMNLSDRAERRITACAPGRAAMWPHWQPDPR